MPSIVPGFEYDIFISYRHNDNRPSSDYGLQARGGWVTEFVHHLNEELAAIIKDPVSVYFDSNPHDGLLETHNVDKSLEGKLKCLIFIPILSQTYCDPKSFAWQQEFCAFNMAAQDDLFGMDIQLPNGNVASRILPIKIHDLDRSDIRMIERETGTTLRSIDFIFKSTGVNRPLQAHEDHPHDNQNKTYYRDQINKVALAIKELIQGIKNPVPPDDEEVADQVATEKSNLGKKIFGATFIFVAIFFGYYAYQKVKDFKAQNPATEVGQPSSIAVLPFDNLSNDPEQEYFCDGTTEQIISSLARLKDLRVIARTSVMRYKKNKKTIGEIGKELNVTHVLEGSVRKSGNQIRVTAKLIAVKDESNLWTDDYNNKAVVDIFQIYDDVATKIAMSLKNKLLPEEQKKLESEKPSNPQAYEHFLKGEYIHINYFMTKGLTEDFLKAEKEFKTAIQLDSNYASAYAGLANLYDSNRGSVEVGRLVAKNADKAYHLNPRLFYSLFAKFEAWKGRIELQTDSALREQQLDSAFKYIKGAYDAAPNSAGVCTEFGYFLAGYLGLHEQGIRLDNYATKIDPGSSFRLVDLARLYYLTGDVRNAELSANKSIALDAQNILAKHVLLLLARDNRDLVRFQQLKNEIRKINPEADPQIETIELALRGEKDQALKAVAKSNNIFLRMKVLLILKLSNETIDELPRAIRSTYDYTYQVLKGPRFNFLKDDSRFKKILAQTKVQYQTRLEKYGNIDLPND